MGNEVFTSVLPMSKLQARVGKPHLFYARAVALTEQQHDKHSMSPRLQQLQHFRCPSFLSRRSCQR